MLKTAGRQNRASTGGQANFLNVCKSQIHKFLGYCQLQISKLRCASPQIANPQIFILYPKIAKPQISTKYCLTLPQMSPTVKVALKALKTPDTKGMSAISPQQQQNTTQQHKCVKNSRGASHGRDANNRRGTNTGGNTRNRRDVNNNRIPATAEHHTTAYSKCVKNSRGASHGRDAVGRSILQTSISG
jgi:hypothetical protein